MSLSEQKINEVGRRAQENANLIWNAANSLFGAFKPHEYGLVILPMCVSSGFTIVSFPHMMQSWRQISSTRALEN